jgi:ATPase subunit of ABC transporter with duplicated ATPase domains
MISFSNINKQYGKQLLFVDAPFQLNPGEKVGLVGPNGAGKTTLFRMVVGEETPDEGAVSVPKKLTIGYFRQDVEEVQGRSVRTNRTLPEFGNTRRCASGRTDSAPPLVQ